MRNLERTIFQPLENYYRVGRNEIVAGARPAHSSLPLIHGLQRLEKIIDEYVGGISTPLRDERPNAQPTGSSCW